MVEKEKIMRKYNMELETLTTSVKDVEEKTLKTVQEKENLEKQT